MKRLVLGSAVVGFTVLFWAVARPAHAQPRNPNAFAPPAVSPYLNLLRRGSDPAINYYGIVRPQVEFRRSIQGLQQDVGTLGNQVTADEQAAELPVTGHPIQFMNYSHYFGASPAGGSTGRRSTPAATAPPPRTGTSSRTPSTH